MDDAVRDAQWSKTVRERDQYVCQLGRSGCLGRATDAAHIIPRRFKALRWEPLNGLALCRRCHDFYDKRLPLLRSEARAILGPEQWERLQQIMVKNYNRRWEDSDV